MIYVGIDVAKDKHDCLITDEAGEVVLDCFTVQNNRTGLDEFVARLAACSNDVSDIKVGLEATGHYSDNLLEFLLDKGYITFVINPLHSNLYRKGLSLRKTKTDTLDALSIVTMLRTENLQSYTPQSYHIRELKSLTRYRFTLVHACAKLKSSYTRLVTILFPELLHLISTLHQKSMYAMLLELPGATPIASCHLTRLAHLLQKTSKGHFNKAKAVEIRNTAKTSIGAHNAAKSLELQQTIRLIRLVSEQIAQVEAMIKPIVDSLHSPIMTIPGISYTIAAMIHAELGDFKAFGSAAKILAFSGMEPSVYQSGQLVSTHAKMVKRGSKYLRWALYQAAKYACRWDSTFAAYLQKKRSEGKAYNVALSHAVKKLVRVMFHLVKSNQPFIRAV